MYGLCPYYLFSCSLTKCYSWIFNSMRKADKNLDNKLNQKELKDFLRHINIEVDDRYAGTIFQVM